MSSIAIAILFVLSSGLYIRTFTFFPVMDEIRHIWDISNTTHWSRYIGHQPWIRPLERIINMLNLHISDIKNNFFSHIVSYTGLFVTTLLVFDVAKRIFNNHIGCAISAGLLFVCHPINVAASYRIDTISQQFATVFSFFLFRWLLVHKPCHMFKFLVITFLYVILTISSKDTSLGMLVAIPIGAYAIRKTYYDSYDLKYLLYALGIVLSTELLYLLVRYSYMQYLAYHTSDRYTLVFSFINILKNLLLYFGSLIYLGNSIDIFLQLDYISIIVSTILCIIFFIILIGGIYRLFKEQDRQNIIIGLSLLFITLSGSFPALLISKVNELYSYGSSPYFCLLAVLLLYNCYLLFIKRVANYSYKKIFSLFFASFFIMMITWLGYSTYDKLSYAENNSIKSISYYKSMLNWLTNKKDIEYSCLSKPSDFTDKHYNFFVVRDDELINGVIKLVQLTSNYTLSLSIQEDSDSCRYLIFKQILVPDKDSTTSLRNKIKWEKRPTFLG